jgi:3-deoxy-D-manno-octulosonate 8-phosphate phosphatase (KDO 8-P phosphatase)
MFDRAVPPIAPELARAIRVVAFDVDGVLTDGGILLGATDSGERVEMKRYDITDGLGIQLLREAGLVVAIITGRESESVRLRAAELGIEECHQDRTAAKLRIMEKLLERHGMGWHQAAFMGDDLPDLPLMRRVALPATVANAVPEVRAVAQWTATCRGGDGAARQLAEALLEGCGEWTRSVERFVSGREAIQ